MQDTRKTKSLLIEELQALRQQLAILKTSQKNKVHFTEREREEAAIQVIKAMASPMILLGLDGRFLFINEAHERMSGYKQAEVVGRHFSEFLQEALKEEETDEIREVTQVAFGGEQTPSLEFTFITTDGREIPLSSNASFINDATGNPWGVVVAFQDITERKRTERTLRESEERFRSLFEGSLDAIFVCDPESGRILDANPVSSELISKPLPDIIGMHYTELPPPRLKERAQERFQEYVEESGSGQPIETALVTSDGTEVPVELLAQLIQVDGKPILIGTFRDISKRRQAEESLRHSEERYRLLVQNSSDIMAMFNEDATLRYISPTVERILGYSLEEMIQEIDFDDIHPEDREEAAAAFDRCLNSPGEVVTAQYRIRHKDGSWRFFEAVGNNVLDNPLIRSIVVNLRDITERKRMEEVLEKAAQLESLGVLCGGIAHDFNNILTAVLTNISMAQMYGDLEEDIGKMLADAEKASLRGKGLTQQLLTFAKGGEPIKKTVSIPTLLKDTIDFALSGSNVRCEYVLPEDLWAVEADEGQIGQVIQNVILNADQAMPGGGIIEARAENVTITPTHLSPLKPGNHVKISIIDHGIGIPEAHLKKVFDPFFTTKQKGSGLGLSTSFSIVKRHGGILQVESSLGRGTKVHIYLPALPERHPARRTRKDTSYRGEGRVLLVDDDETLRRSVGTALGRLGYHVDQAEDGEKGIEIYREARDSGRPIDAVVMDLTIPGSMGGKETAQELLKMDPGAKLIVSSGYSTDPVMSNFKSHGFCAVISKPYRIEDLGETLRKVLTGEDT